MDGMRIRRAVDSPSAPWENREPTASRRIDIQAKSKTPRSPKKTREARRKSEGRSDLRAKALEFSMDAINAFTPGSPMRPKRTDRGRKMTPSASGYENSLSSVENTRDHSAPRGKRRNQPADKTAGTAFVGAAGSDHWRMGATNQIDEPSSTRGPPPGLETDGSPLKLTSREASKPRRREDNKPATRSTTSRRNSTRGNDKGASTTRRQVYREKQVKEIVKEASLTEDVAPLPSAALQSPRKSQSRSDSPTFSKTPEKKATIAQNAKDKDHAASPAKSAAAVPKAAKPTDVSTEVPAEVAKTTAIQSPAIERVEGGNPDHVKNANVDEETSIPEVVDSSLETPSSEPATSAERESSSSSDGPEDAQDAVNEQSESCQERVVDSPESDDILSHVESSEDDTEQCQVSTQKLPTTLSKKSKRRSGALTAASADSSAASPQTEAEPFSAHELISTPLVEKKHGTKEHRKERSKKEKGEKKKPTRGKKDKKVVSKTADAVSGSASEAQDKILEDLATRGTPLSARISQGLRKGGSAAASAGLVAFLGTRRGCVWVAGRLNIKGLLATSFSYVDLVVYPYPPGGFPCNSDAPAYRILLRISLRLSLPGTIRISMGSSLGASLPMVRFPRPAFLHERTYGNGDDIPCNSPAGLSGGGYIPPQFSPGSERCGASSYLIHHLCFEDEQLVQPHFLPICLLAVFLGSELVVQWLQLALALYSLHLMAATDDEWPAPSSAVSIQKTKRLDRRALAYLILSMGRTVHVLGGGGCRVSSAAYKSHWLRRRPCTTESANAVNAADSTRAARGVADDINASSGVNDLLIAEATKTTTQAVRAAIPAAASPSEASQGPVETTCGAMVGMSAPSAVETRREYTMVVGGGSREVEEVVSMVRVKECVGQIRGADAALLVGNAPCCAIPPRAASKAVDDGSVDEDPVAVRISDAFDITITYFCFANNLLSHTKQIYAEDTLLEAVAGSQIAAQL
ncbi:hypothetical protein ON010_g9107 [Phytophthora cinnamomi]|nr:hypothetical protein ON010_g9107 [Phytophthora cinnamomi]